jgi:hypothetical protein
MNYQTLASASGSQYPEFFSEWIEPIATDTELTIKNGIITQYIQLDAKFGIKIKINILWWAALLMFLQA